MAIELRDYQADLIERTRAELGRNRAVLMQSPTGSGKTALTVHMIAGAAARGNRSIFAVHRRELMEQTSHALWAQNVAHGQIAPNRRPSKLPVQVASIPTLARRLKSVAPPELLVIDEAHRAAAVTYRRIIEAWPKTKIVGLTATPQRTDGQGLDDLFDALVVGPPVRWLIERGWLCDYRLIAPPEQADLSGVKRKGGDYDRSDLAERMDRPTVIGDAIDNYRRYGNDGRCLTFCVSRKHGRHVCERYLSAGIRAEHVDGETPDAERRAALERFRKGQTRVITSVDLFIEGLDVPAVDVVQLLRPTQSLIVYLQAVGRGFRPAEGKNRLTIIDHVGNWHRHGLPDAEREWALEGRERKPRGRKEEESLPPMRQCDKCYTVFRPQAMCPNCGEAVIAGREIEEKDGELYEVDLDAARRERKREQGRARTLEDLVSLGVRRGYRNPSVWAVKVLASRENRRPTKEEFSRAKAFQYGAMMEAS